MANIIPFRQRPANDDEQPTPPGGGAQIVSIIACRSDDPVRQFNVAYHQAMIAHAEHDLIEAKFLAMHWCNPVGAQNEYWGLRGETFNRMWAAVDRVAAMPAMTSCQLRMKKTAIGSVWLRAEGERYEEYRQSVAADDARLKAQKAA